MDIKSYFKSRVEVLMQQFNPLSTSAKGFSKNRSDKTPQFWQ
jgi:hypothetical protein